MKSFIGGSYGKSIIIEMERGEKIIETVSERLKEAGIKNAVVASAVGSLQKVVFHRPTGFQASTVDEFVTVEEPLEITSLTGTVIDGVPHFHFSAAGLKNMYGGHLETDSEVLYLVEITLVEINGYNLERRITKEKVKKLFNKD